jgi:hypothetical protein
MAVIDSAEDLLRALPDGFDPTDLKGELQRKGHSLSPELDREYTTRLNRYRTRVGAAKLKRWSDLRTRSRGFRVAKEQPLMAVKRKAPGDWDLIASVKLTTVDEVLRGLLAARTIPRVIDLRHFLSAGELKDAMALFRANFTGVPDGDAVTPGKLHLLEVLPTQPIDGSNQIRLALRVTLDFVGPADAVLTQLSAEMRVIAIARADISFTGEPSMVIRIAFPDAFTADMIVLNVASTSPVQPRSAAALERFAILLGLILKRSLEPQLPTLALSPLIRLPKLTETTILVNDIQLRARAADGGTLVVGARVGDAAPAGDPDRLVSPFAGRDANFHMRLHEDLLKEAVRRAKESGDLEKLARQEDDDLRIDFADAELRNNQIRFLLRGRVVDACASILDARWDAHFDITFKPDGNKIAIEYSGDASPDWSHPKTYLCILVMLALGVVAAIGLGLLTSPTIVAIVGVLLAIDNLSKIEDVLLGVNFSGDSVLSLNVAVPGTELLPRLAPVLMTTAVGAQNAWYALTFIPDGFNVHVYAQVNLRGLPPARVIKPLSGAKVRLMDQDAPRPAKDDSVIPPTGTKVEKRSRKIAITVETEFQAPAQDNFLGEATTTTEGIAHFTVHPGLFRNNAGHVVTTRITERFDTGKTDIRTSRKPVVESRPDLYFLITPEGGRPVDSRNEIGLLLNATRGNVGTADAPIQLSVNAPRVIVRRDPVKLRKSQT